MSQTVKIIKSKSVLLRSDSTKARLNKSKPFERLLKRGQNKIALEGRSFLTFGAG